MKNSDKPIYPFMYKDVVQTNKTPIDDRLFGLTKREYFAAMAMQGLCANYLRENVTGWDIKTYAVEALALADELLNQLSK